MRFLRKRADVFSWIVLQAKWKVASNGVLYCGHCAEVIDAIVSWRQAMRVPDLPLLLQEAERVVRGVE